MPIQVIPCSLNFPVGDASINADGTYTIEGLSTGSYYLHTGGDVGNYLNEWWAAPLSVVECANAQVIAVTAGDVVSGQEFPIGNRRRHIRNRV